jgi:HD-like signal output (HDOD) protein
MATQINIADIQRAARNSVPLIFRLAVLLPESLPLLDRICEIYLGELGQEKILEPLSYCVKELISNAQKANAKRVYFEERGLNLARQEDYARGMEGFLRETSENLLHFQQLLRDRRMSVEVTFHKTGDTLRISVRNSARLIATELARINDRIARARSFHSFFEVLETSVDHTEGAGLGIMMLLQFLKRIGVSDKAFSIRSDNGSTVSSIAIPMPEIHLEQVRILADVLVRDIESLPHFPESIRELLQLTSDPNASIARITQLISTSPALTADLLRQANSAYYGRPTRVDSVLKAVKMMGMRSLHYMLYSLGFQMMLAQHRSRLKALWEHSLRTAFYATFLARDITRNRDVFDDAYVAGILHDLGFIVVTALHPATQTKMRRFSVEKNIPPRILERFSFGMHHADIGALIAEKWNFPDQLVEGIKFHHDPLLASGRYRDVVFCVYLANAICDLERGMLTYTQMEKPVLADFGIRSKEQLLEVARKLRTAYESRSVDPAAVDERTPAGAVT